ncbi:MAG TPA: MopE-related protein [Kofleriaceae bacterium]|nr:MopE-related protein [Kofleriaceae bacterium]
MTNQRRSLRRLIAGGAIAASLTVTVLSLESEDAGSAGIATVMTAKSLPEATIAVIDPESGTSSGTSGSDVNISVGDIILFRFAFSPVPDQRNRSMQAWLTEYIPPGTELVGARIIDEDGLTILPRYPGLAIDGCAGGALCNSYDNVPCTNGVGSGGTLCSGNVRDLAGGSIAQVHADTGIFWSNSGLTARRPSDRFITMDNGIEMTPIPSGISPGLTAILDKSSGPYYAHNTWDWAQVLAYGVTGSGTNARGEPINASLQGGDGNSPFLYGSPVAGPHSFYRYEATPTVNASGNITAIRFDDVDGPWRRVRYPGSKIGFGNCLSNTTNGSNVTCSPQAGNTSFSRNIAAASGIFTGDDVTPANPVSPTAVRFALGEMRTGDPVQVEVALRVLQVPFDPNYAPAGDNVNCGEVIGSSLAQRGTGQDGDTHPWVTYIATPACVFLKLLLDVTTDKPLSAGQNSTFTMRLKNLKTSAETGVVAYMQFSNNRIAFVSATPAPDAPGLIACPAPLDTSKDCVKWTVGTMNPSDEFLVAATFSAGGGGNTSGVLQGVYTSDSLPAPGFSSADLTIITPIAKVHAAMSFPNPTTTFASPGGTATITGTLSNDGTEAFDFDRVRFFLPSGWTIADGPDTGTVPDITIGGVTINCSANCATNSPIFPHSVSYPVGTSRVITAVLNVPNIDMAVHPVDLQIWGTQTGFGGQWETYFPAIAEVPVAAVRTEPPIIDCLTIGSTSTAITGTSEPNADIRALFNLIERGNGTADGVGDWSVTNFTAFGELYGGLEVRATAELVPSKNISELSLPCDLASRRECSDGLDNDGDGLIDFPSDPGCDSPTDNSEASTVTECSDSLDNDGANGIDWPIDPSCHSPEDPTEDGVPACSDGIDNDGDGLIDFPADPDCYGADDPSEDHLRQCQDRIDNDGDGLIDFDGLGDPALADPGCHSAFDDDESTPSFVDDARGRILVVFDTSGSMNRNTCENDPADEPFTGGDGSLDCPGDDVLCADIPATCAAGQATCGNGVADDSRIFKVKVGISDVVASFGEVEYALMRFSQRGVEFACPGTNAGLRSGGWQGGGLSPCDGGFNAGDVVVGFARDNAQTILEFMDGETNYPIGDPPARLDLELRGSGSTPLGGSLQSALTYLNGVQAGDLFAGCRQYRVILVTDGDETCGGNPTQAATDLYNAGYPVTVIGFATGDPGIDAQLDAIAAAGSDPAAPSSAIFVSDEAALSAAMAQVVQDSIVFEVCDGIDNDCDGLTDEGFPVGGACDNGELGVCLETGTIVCSGDGQTTVCDAPAGTPNPPETCNNLDDDCDGKIDEGLVCNCLPEICNGLDDDCDGTTDEGVLPGENDSCGIDVGECTPGTLACNRTIGDPDFGTLECLGGTGPTTEICDGLDNDCDAFVDEVAVECYTGATGCTLGTPSTCVGTCSTGVQTCDDPGTPQSTLSACTDEVLPNDPEFCDGFDDDCDGSIDENYPVGGACDNGQLGVCNVTGQLVCNQTRDGVVCNAPPVNPGLESCNGLDDDCDGRVDELLPPPIGDACGGGGGCSGGTFQCVSDGMGGANIECTGQAGGSPEVCDGLDNDCDMRIDEFPTDPELNPPPGDECTPPGFETLGDTGECEFGNYICQAGMIVCDGYVGPRPEVCNGLDDDCDGVIDDMATCPSAGEICLDGECVGPCMPGEFPCPFGFQCNTFPDETCDTPPCRYCVSDPCVDVTCPVGFACDSTDGQCVDLCDGVNCQANTTCVNGFCLDCFQLGCPDGQVCTASDGCVTDPCAGVECGTEAFCREGDCIPLACNPACEVGTYCNDGVCEDDLCVDKTCGANQVCRPSDGMCIGDLCNMVMCPPGRACHPGTGDCIDDPCLTSECPPGQVCSLDLDGDPTCAVPEPPKGDEGDYVYASGGGCSAAGGGTGPASVLVLLGLMLAVGRRRRPWR